MLASLAEADPGRSSPRALETRSDDPRKVKRENEIVSGCRNEIFLVFHRCRIHLFQTFKVFHLGQHRALSGWAKAGGWNKHLSFSYASRYWCSNKSMRWRYLASDNLRLLTSLKGLFFVNPSQLVDSEVCSTTQWDRLSRPVFVPD